MRRKALFMVLSEKAKSNLLVVLDDFQTQNPKTKEMALTIKKLPINVASRLVVSPNADKKTFLMARNIKKTGVLEARNLNVADILQYKYILISREGIKDMEATFSKKK